MMYTHARACWRRMSARRLASILLRPPAARPASTSALLLVGPSSARIVPIPSHCCQRRVQSTTSSSPSTTTSPPQQPSLYSAAQKQVMDQCQQLHSSIMQLNERLHGPLTPHSDRGTALPFVLLVGNHSSGKSSFINYVLQRDIQTAGVAPTDDAFTIIAPGPVDRDQDGPAVTGDPDLGFAGLRQFGPTLQHHTVLKIRSNINCNFIMVDSPGMIDAPANYSGMMLNNNNSSSNNTMDRGYDFTGVVRWFADRADIVCLFFDPDKPGTTGETLSILLHALSGMDHKLLIVLNKADQFAKIHDFARAYGSLCWNLSKVIPRKDLPRIYTMCLPVAENKYQPSTENNNHTSSNSTTTLKQIPSALQDLHTARDEVVAQVRRAPERRLDNVITGLQDAVAQLRLHAIVLQDLRQRWSKFYWQNLWTRLGVAATGTGVTAALMTQGAALGGSTPQVAGAVLGATVLLTGGLHWYHGSQMAEWERQATSREELGAAFQRTHARAVQEGDEHVAALWQRIRDPLAAALQRESSIGDLESVTQADLEGLDYILNVEIPRLRRQVSPSHFGKEA